MPKHILIVDDEPDVVQIIQTILRSKGYQVTGVTDGQSGLDITRRNRPDLILCDLMMPGMSGMEFIRQVRRDPQIAAIPVIALSALGSQSDKSEDFWKKGLNADDFLAKPFDPLDLLGRVEYIFRRQNYVSTQDETSPGVAVSNGAMVQSEKPRADLSQSSPKMLVRSFIEAWNNQDFSTEYRCLAEEMTGGLSEREYIARRRQCYLDEHGDQRHQHVTNYIEDNTSHNAAKVVLEREDVIGDRKRLRKETYVLRRGQAGWKIISMRSVPLTGQNKTESGG
jgi:CheY-like chemotaxis protein